MKMILGRRPIGQILKDGGFLSGHQLEQALKEQQRGNEKLGEILVRLGILEPADLQAALSVQRHLGTLDQAVRLGAGVRQMLGALLVESGQLTAEQLQQALAEQQGRGGRLGEICVKMGLLSQPQMEALVNFQTHQEREHPHPLRLGELLISAGYLQRDQLEDALRRQRPGQKLGEVLLEAGYAQQAHINHGIRLQRLLMGSALAAILSLAELSLSGCGSETGPAASAEAPVAVAAPARNTAVSTAPAANYFTMTADDFGLISPNFYYSTDNESFWSIQANVSKSATDINAVAVYRIDIPKNAGPVPQLNHTFSIEDGTGLEKFPGEFLVLNGAKSVHKKVERGVIAFTPDSTAAGTVKGTYDVTMTDYDANVLPAPQYHLKGAFNFVMGSYGPARVGG